MSSKTIGVRFPDNLIETIKADGGKFNTAVIERLQNSIADEKAAALDVKGVFTDSEQKAIGKALTGSKFDSALLYSRELVVNHFEASAAAFAESGANLQAVCQKVNGLTRLQLATVLRLAARA